MRVLVGFEYSGIVSQAFRDRGHEAYSCDIVPGLIPKYHFQEDVFSCVSRLQPDLAIFHPPCTFLCNAQLFKCVPGSLRYCQQQAAIKTVRRLWALPIPMICIENPKGILSRVFRPPDQILYPYWFGDPYKKDICFWLKNLSPLIATNYSVLRKSMSNHVNGRMSQELKSHIKSKFFPGLSSAMANQWSY